MPPMQSLPLPKLLPQLVRFALVGGIGFIVDVALFNVLRLTVLSPDVLAEGPVLAKVASTSVAIGVNWLGSRYWSFRLEQRRPAAREGFEFLAASLLGMGAAVLCLVISRDVLGFTSVLADNIASNVIGLALGSALRFALYRWWVFHPRRSGATAAPAASATTGATNATSRSTATRSPLDR